MINSNAAVDFSDCRSKEVISLFWRSVYITCWDEWCVDKTRPEFENSNAMKQDVTIIQL